MTAEVVEWPGAQAFEVGDKVICPKCHGLGFVKRRWWIFSWKQKCPRAFIVTAINVQLQEKEV